MSGELTYFLLGVLKDVKCELDTPEVAELTTIALDRKVEAAIELLEQELDGEKDEND